ncbi:PDZ domain-containing protein [Halovenus aranensis]|uniref:PDZ domain-containing protein n=1 Tax=Halovenus aranensis TaxID=890420 RepID=A0A1G8TQF8_9EURY|nr:site-2 protease family protein [Halovenus aranensis]SDJ43185.1 PDZ domain-containing protein [Halovenus aranensis]
MVDLLTGVLVGLVIYTVIAMALRAYGYLPDYIRVSGPLLTIKTRRGRQFLDRLASPKRFWRAWGNIGVGIALVVMVLAGIVVALSVPAIITQPETAAIESPQNVLVIPGVNDFLPLSAAPEILFGLLVGLVVHEGGHGLLCRVDDIEIDSMGIALIGFIPLGAFVEPDIDDQRDADRGAQARMFAAGITNNFAVTAIALVGLVVLTSFVTAAPGAAVGDTFAGSGAADAGIERGDVITHIDGTPVENATEFEDHLADTDAEQVTVSRRDAEDVPVDRRLLITGAVSDAVPGIMLGGDQQPIIETVNGTAVSTEGEFVRAVEGRTVAAIETTRGNETLPLGAYIFHVDSGGPMESAGAPTDDSFIVTRIGDTRVTNASAFGDHIDSLAPGTEVTVDAFVDGDRTSYNVTVGGSPSNPRLGVAAADGYSGISVNDFGIDPYPAENFLAMLGGDAVPEDFSAVSGFLWYHVQLLVLPFATLIVDGFSYNFAGFTSSVSGFFVVEGPFSAFGGSLLAALSLLFWTWWINFNLAIFNCIPAFPLDGGHILRAATESIASRLPTSYGREIVTVVTVALTLGMIAALAVLLFGPLLLT